MPDRRQSLWKSNPAAFMKQLFKMVSLFLELKNFYNSDKWYNYSGNSK